MKFGIAEHSGISDRFLDNYVNADVLAGRSAANNVITESHYCTHAGGRGREGGGQLRLALDSFSRLGAILFLSSFSCHAAAAASPATATSKDISQL